MWLPFFTVPRYTQPFPPGLLSGKASQAHVRRYGSIPLTEKNCLATYHDRYASIPPKPIPEDALDLGQSKDLEALGTVLAFSSTNFLELIQRRAVGNGIHFCDTTERA